MRYLADPPDGLRIVPLDSLTAIYQRRSGQTHVVAEPVPEILAALAEPADIDALIGRLGVPATEESRALIAARLDELTETGLVERL